MWPLSIIKHLNQDLPVDYIQEQRLKNLGTEIDSLTSLLEQIDEQTSNRGSYLAMPATSLPPEKRAAVKLLRSRKAKARYQFKKLLAAAREAQAAGLTEQW